jgi:hypothetical protein
MSGIETQKCIKPIFSDKLDKSKSKSFVQIYDVETGTFVINIYNYVSEKFFKFAFKNAFDGTPSRFHTFYREITVRVEDTEDDDGFYFLGLEQIYVCFIYKAGFVVVQFGYNFHLNIIELKSSQTFECEFDADRILIEKNGNFRIC